MSAEISQASHSAPRRKRVLIVGGSTRAAAWSARRAGLDPICADLFADVDARQVAEMIPVRDYPYSLASDVAQVEADSWFYTGGLENHPDLIEQIQRGKRCGELWGTAPESLRLIRNPFWVAEILGKGGWPALEVRSEEAAPAADGTWIRKPVSSAGGNSVCVWDASAPTMSDAGRMYFQRRQAGQTYSATFHRSASAIEFLGITRQLDSHPIAGGQSFLYSGSVGPISRDDGLPLYEKMRSTIVAMARLLAIQAGLAGVFGIDFIPDEQGVPWILEINPRYTAVVEILELALQRSLLGLPMAASERRSADSETAVVAKRILYASAPLQVPDMTEFCRYRSEWEVPSLADIPAANSTADSQWPICTVLAAGSTLADCLQRLDERVEMTWRMIGSSGKDGP